MQNKTLQMKRAMRTALLVLLLSVVGMGKGYATYDFSAVCPTGQTLYYRITDATNQYVALTYPGGYFTPWEGFVIPTGNIVLPSTVQYNGITYMITSIGDYAFCGCDGLTGSLTIPSSVTSIEREAFRGCHGFTGNLIIPESVTMIGDMSFFYCGFTGSLTIPNSVTTIGGYAFAYGSGFTGNLTIPNSVTMIGYMAFAGCSGLTGSLIIPNSVISIGPAAFAGCSGIEHIVVESGNTSYDSRDNCDAIIESETNTLIAGCKNSIIPSTVTIIGQYAFAGCSGLTGNLIIPNSVTTIGEEAFELCSGLTGNLIIPNSVISIGLAAFAGCSGIEHIVVESGNTTYDSRDNCDAIIESETNTLIAGCKNSIIPNSITIIEFGAFHYCIDLISITIPNSVTSINNDAFSHCNGLTSVTLGSSVDYIGMWAFDFCNNIEEFVVLNPEPPTIDYQAFPFNDRKLIVCCGNKEAYQTSGWTNFFSTIEEDCNPHDVIIDENSMNGGNVSTSITSTELGEEVQLTITPDEGMMLASLIVSNANDPSQTVPVYSIGKNSSVYGFIMPPFDVVITATFGPATTIGENIEAIASVYPNPTNSKVIIETENLKHITINNTFGQTVYDGNACGEAFEYDFSNHKAGIYLIRIETESGVVTKKVSVER